jgi:predicted transcriptional regulator of viral defense system
MSERGPPLPSAPSPEPAGRAREERIADTVARQHGVVSRAQLLDAGVSSAAIGRRLKTGRLRAFHSGVYLAGPIEPERAREMAAVMASGPGAALSHVNALHVWRLLRFQAPRPVHVSGPVERHVRRTGIVTWRQITRKPTETAVLVGQALALAEARRQTAALAALPTRGVDRSRP